MHNDFLPRKPAPKLKPTPTTPDQNKTDKEQTVPFQTPDQVSQHDQQTDHIPLERSAERPPRGTGHHWFNMPWPPKRAEIWALCIILVVAVFGVAGFIMFNKPEVTETVATVTPVKKAPKPTTVASALSGRQVQPEVNQRPVVGVMIENSKEARPQSGLREAGVVFEAIAEGGITRFLALYQDQQPDNIGPIRSARPYYVQWNESFRAAYVHVGGSSDALQNIKDWGVQDINQYYNGGSFRREKSRASPHNVYSSVGDLAKLASQKGFKSEFTSFPRKTAKAAKQPTASSVNLNISSSLYNVNYTFDAASNTYLRAEGGAAHTDSNTGKQLSPDVVIAMVVPLSAGGRTSQGGSYSNYRVIGNGAAYIFQDGTVTQATWNKTSNTSQISFTDASGAPVKLNPGQTWITAVSSTTKVTYQ